MPPKVRLQPEAWLAALLAPAEDPRNDQDSPAERHQRLLEQLRQSLSIVSDSKTRLVGRAAEAEAHLPELAVRARQAVAVGRLDLARSALRRRQLATADLAELRRQVEDLEAEEARLTLVEQRVTAAIEAYHAKHELARAKYTAAAAQIRVGEALAGVSDDLGDLGAGLLLAEERAERMEARATAIDRLVAEGVLEGRALPHDAETVTAVEAELAALLHETTRLDFQSVRTLNVDLHGHDVLTAVDFAAQRVHEAYSNGYEAVELLHGAGDVSEPVESGRGRIKWALRRVVEEGRLDGYIDRSRTWLKAGSIVLYLKKNPQARRERWSPDPPRSHHR